MDIQVRKDGDVCILDVTGELKFGPPVALLRQRSRELIDAGERLFVLNMERSPWLDSSGIGEVVGFHKRAREKRGVVKLVLKAGARSQFTLVQLEKLFDIFDDVAAAVASFTAPDGGYRERF